MNAPRQTYQVGTCLAAAFAVPRSSEFDFPAFWAWHRSLRGEPSRAPRRVCNLYRLLAHACLRGEGLRGCEDRVHPKLLLPVRGAAAYERKCSPHMINIPRALFTGRTDREPRYHVAIEELQDWTYTGNRLVPLKGYPGIVWERPKSRWRPATLMTLSSSTGASRTRVPISSGEGICVPKI